MQFRTGSAGRFTDLLTGAHGLRSGPLLRAAIGSVVGASRGVFPGCNRAFGGIELDHNCPLMAGGAGPVLALKLVNQGSGVFIGQRIFSSTSFVAAGVTIAIGQSIFAFPSWLEEMTVILPLLVIHALDVHILSF